MKLNFSYDMITRHILHSIFNDNPGQGMVTSISQQLLSFTSVQTQFRPLSV